MRGDHLDGEIRKNSDGYDLVFTRRLRQPIEKVWAAITVPERIAAWFTEMTFDPDLRLGATVRVRFDDPVYETTGRVVAFEPPRLFAWTWPHDEHPHSVVRCELTPDGEGCRLTFTQTGLAATHLSDVGAGWHTYLEGLEAVAAGGAAAPWSREREAEHERRYSVVVARL